MNISASSLAVTPSKRSPTTISLSSFKNTTIVNVNIPTLWEKLPGCPDSLTLSAVSRRHAVVVSGHRALRRDYLFSRQAAVGPPDRNSNILAVEHHESKNDVDNCKIKELASFFRINKRGCRRGPSTFDGVLLPRHPRPQVLHQQHPDPEECRIR